MQTLCDAARALRAGDRFLILTHRRPDGDTIGSAAALCLMLRAMGKQAWILENPQRTERYAAYWDGLTCTEAPEDAIPVSVDVASEDMLLLGAEPFIGRIAIALDHHETNPGYAACTCVRADYAATGELIFELCCVLDLELDARAAEAIYLAISTDTGGFRYSNTTEHTFLTAAACCAAGADIFPINRSFFTVKSPARIRLEAHLGSTIEFLSGGRIGICALSRADMARLSANEDDADDLSGFARSIEGVEIGVMLRDLPDGTGKISLRTGDDVNAAALCAQLGGGGHRAAAGASVPGGIEGAKAAILRVLADAGLLQ